MRLWDWMKRNILLIASLIVMFLSIGGDGRYIRSYQFAGWFGAVLGYGLNFSVDGTTELLAYEAARHFRDVARGKARIRKRWMAAMLVVGQLAMVYFAVVFSYRQYSLTLPNEPNWLRWSMAALAPAALTLLGIAQALRLDMGTERKRTTRVEPTGAPTLETEAAYICSVCHKTFAKQQALAGHMKAHGNGHEEGA